MVLYQLLRVLSRNPIVLHSPYILFCITLWKTKLRHDRRKGKNTQEIVEEYTKGKDMEEVKNIYITLLKVFQVSFARPSNKKGTKMKSSEGRGMYKMIIKFIRLIGVQENSRCVLCGPSESLWTQYGVRFSWSHVPCMPCMNAITH